MSGFAAPQPEIFEDISTQAWAKCCRNNITQLFRKHRPAVAQSDVPGHVVPPVPKNSADTVAVTNLTHLLYRTLLTLPAPSESECELCAARLPALHLAFIFHEYGIARNAPMFAEFVVAHR